LLWPKEEIEDFWAAGDAVEKRAFDSISNLTYFYSGSEVLVAHSEVIVAP
jgi:hypothetical protein